MHAHDPAVPPITDGPLDPDLGYEPRDTNTRAVAIGGAVLVVTVAVVLVALLVVYRSLATGTRHEDRDVVRNQTIIAPQTLAIELRALREAEDATLGSYAYDRATGTVRLPIDRAIDLVAERGVPKGKGPRTDIQINSRDRTPDSKDSPAPAAKKESP